MNETTQTAPRPGQPGYKPSAEQLRKMQEGMRARNAEKKRQREAAAARREGAQTHPPAAPSVAGAAVPEKLRKKIVDLIVGPAIDLMAASGMFVARRITAPRVPVDEQGQPTVSELQYKAMLEEHRRIAFEEDKLEKWERDYVADELTTELLRWPRVRAFLLQAVAILERGGLAAALSLVIGYRMVRHGMVPPEFREWATEAVQALREEAKKRRGVKDDEAGGSSQNGARPEAPSPHYTEPAVT